VFFSIKLYKCELAARGMQIFFDGGLPPLEQHTQWSTEKVVCVDFIKLIKDCFFSNNLHKYEFLKVQHAEFPLYLLPSIAQ